jgi:hypothetical protein
VICKISVKSRSPNTCVGVEGDRAAADPDHVEMGGRFEPESRFDLAFWDV